MSILAIGEVIRTLRKQLGITQEELAKNIGVSTQAVSKWECGGVPDTELIPIIADYFSVSIDTLFGRNVSDYKDIDVAVANKIASAKETDRMKVAFELCWVIERAIGGTTELEEYYSLNSIRDKEENLVYSRMLFDSGITLMCLKEQLPYFMLMPQGENVSKALLEDVNYHDFFKLLADAHIFETMILLYKRENKAFTPKLLIKNLNISEDKALEILTQLKKYQLISTSDIELDDEIQEIYSFMPNPAFLGLLILAKEMIIKTNGFYWHHSYRNTPYLK